MEKLQLYINKSLRGFKTLVNINGAEWSRRHLRDLRPALEAITYDTAEKCVFYYLQYIEGGTFVSVLRTIPDKPLDHLAATIVVPACMRITAAQLATLLRELTRMVSKPGMNSDDIARLRVLFDTPYPIDTEAARQIPSEGRQTACRHYGSDGDRLIDYLGDNLYQPAFVPYNGVLLVDADLPFEITGVCLDDVPLSKVVALLPPPEVPGYVPHLMRRRFDVPFKVALGSEVQIVWKRSGFDDVIETFQVDADGMQPPAPRVATAHKAVTPASFYITSRYSDDPIADCVITVNGCQITGQHTFTQAELESAEVEITAPGYKPYHATLDLASTVQALIELVEEKPRKGRKAVATPVTAGDVVHADDMLRSAAGGKPWWLKALMVLIGVGVALGLCFWLIPGVFGGFDHEPLPGSAVDTVPANSLGAYRMTTDSNRTATPAQGADQATAPSGETPAANVPSPAPPAKTEQPAASVKDAAAAAKYLDENSYWTADGMAKYEVLKGYYHDLETFNLEALTKVWPKRLPDSKWVATIGDHASQAIQKKLDPKAKGNTYRLSGRNKIHRKEYINWINRRQDEPL